ncbi:hypothetical protein FACS1894132_08410 [Clostridia bacterium]|nr:hypothetical protein FACS1894132_08410 [Clostridia bacterium]
MLKRRIKVYLDTSVISHLEQPTKSTEFDGSHLFWNNAEKLDIVLSDTVFSEISNCSKDKERKLLSYINEIRYENLEIISEIKELTKDIISRGIIPPSSKDDATHIATALYAECDYLLSWNMKHLACVRANDGVRILTLENHMKELKILTPLMILSIFDEVI